MYDNRRYVVFPVSELNLINFDQVMETDSTTVRKSIDGTKTFVKYDLPMPSSVASVQNKSQEYIHDDFLEILATEEWTEPFSIEP